MSDQYIEVTQEAGRAFVMSNHQGAFVMLNFLKFRETADYSANPGLAPPTPISGEEAYNTYITHTLPLLEKAGSALIFKGTGGNYLIGPPDKRWDLVLLVRHRSVEDFMAFATDSKYLAGAGHRTAALEDSRLLPIVEENL